MENPPDWDLHAVVRSCCTTTTSVTTSTVDPPPPPPPPPPPRPCYPPPSTQNNTSSSSSTGVLFQFSNNPFESSSTTSFLDGHHELQDICQPMFCTTTAAPPTTNTNTTNINSFQSISSASLVSPVSSPSSVITARSFAISEQHYHHRQQQQQQHQQQQQQPQLRGLVKPSQVIFGGSSATIGATNNSHVQRTKKRKNLMKKVCHVPAEGLSSDMWAWRKYGQKPIKGSPYPRGYYRCSSSKGCLARKQVERNRSDPKIFIVTYTAEHNHPMPTHRNSLAGSTRQKSLSSAETAAEKPSCSSPSAASLSPLTEKSESKTEGDDVIKEEEDTSEMALSDLILNDDFYVGFDQIDGSDGSDCFSDQFSPSSEFPWLASSSSSTATAAGGS